MAKGTVNKVIILGRLGVDPEIRTTQSGMVVGTLSIATNDGKDENMTTEWHRVVVFEKTAKTIQEYAKKGTQLYVEGRLRTNKWTDKNGDTRYTTEIIANNFQFINDASSPKTDSPNQQENNSTENLPSLDELNNLDNNDVPS